MRTYTYGPYGGAYVPEVLHRPLAELTEAFGEALRDPAFLQEFQHILTHYVGRSTPLFHAANLSRKYDCQVYLKREDLAHTGAHKINNTIGQALLAKRMGKKRVIAETGAGQHGVATATAAALLGLECTVFMGSVDARRQEANLFRMRLLGAQIQLVESGSKTLKDATSEAIRNWIATADDTYYIIGSALGPSPYPKIVQTFQSVIGSEIRSQFYQQHLRHPDAVIACVGGGSNAIGTFSGYYEDRDVRLYGVEAGGYGLASGQHAAPISEGNKGILHGFFSYFMCDENGNIRDTHSVSAGLDYPGVGPELAWLADSGRVEYIDATDEQALAACMELARCEGILPALESSHAIAAIPVVAAKHGPGCHIVVTLSGRGDKDMGILQEKLQP
ncbi:tryptophan synthase subunit beta [Desulfurispirillum indicum]|uniref:Tryptophan synthase beta chain n=1 Tax=Desulfurispirillum indicum (strain ATCC BAA-1389 / DSM 22839 / S5) TaxID=653733 RepID=E6W2W7_DESIS|nr:tryptophan synthase subunit beta [Desulfurispirillum indicum]ADU66792.1 tryptophan synthase, beta subunit [Desulfurispirillum indicum S5]UCZ56111.1 tryptophan synthase subunit beta [Desulfurispirillum indicum]